MQIFSEVSLSMIFQISSSGRLTPISIPDLSNASSIFLIVLKSPADTVWECIFLDITERALRAL